MKMEFLCIECLVKACMKLIADCETDENKRLESAGMVLEKIAHGDFNLNQVEFNYYLQDFIRTRTGKPDPYLEFKRQKNRMALESVDRAEQMIDESDDRLLASIMISTAGNIMDTFAGQDYDLEGAFRNIWSKGYKINHYSLFKEKLVQGESVLFIADNAGEIVLDGILIKELADMGKKITVCVKGGPAADDALREDYYTAGLEKFSRLADTGTGHQGFFPEYLSCEARREYENADLIIAKGMGNFETLCEIRDPRIFLNFKAKCVPIARRAGVEVGDFVFRNAR